MRIGYARVSTREQNTDGQLDDVGGRIWEALGSGVAEGFLVDRVCESLNRTIGDDQRNTRRAVEEFMTFLRSAELVTVAEGSVAVELDDRSEQSWSTTR